MKKYSFNKQKDINNCTENKKSKPLIYNPRQKHIKTGLLAKHE